MTSYRAYDYHNADTNPVNNEDLNIFGVELEIDNRTDRRAEIIDNAIENNIITAPTNEGFTRNWKVIEDDGSVWKEIILNADTFENLLKRIECLNRYGITPANFENSAGTSCHIHINRQYLEELNISETNIFKMVEFFAPVIFRISGRTLNQFLRWASPRSKFKTLAIDWKARGEHIGHLHRSGERYQLLNLNRFSTVEMRGFSNRCSFDYNTLKFYFEFIEFLISEAVYMKGRYYKEEGENLINHFLEWIEPEQYKKYNIGLLFEKETNLIPRLQDLQKSRYEIMELRRASTGHRSIYDFIGLLLHPNNKEWLQIINNRLTLTEQGVINASSKILNKISENRAEYMSIYYENKYIFDKHFKGGF